MSEPNLVTSTPKRRMIPELRSPWWAGLLVLSLMANLAVGGVVIGSKLKRGPGPFAFLENRAQLLPRNFFADLPHERRKELMGLFEAKRDQLMREKLAADTAALKFAETLGEQGASAEKIKSVVDEFAVRTSEIVKQGNEIVLDVVAKLTPEERSRLAYMIRERASHMPRK